MDRASAVSPGSPLDQHNYCIKRKILNMLLSINLINGHELTLSALTSLTGPAAAAPIPIDMALSSLHYAKRAPTHSSPN